MENIDFDTNPICNIREEKFDWGEPYNIYTPIFKTDIEGNLSLLEFSIELFGKNNFKKQLLLLHNKLANYEEFNSIENLNEEISNREHLLDLINKYIVINNECITPWVKYSLSITETDYINLLEEILNLKLNYVKEI
ncbi:hypothetical protein [Flavobacterium sp. N502540]|uniref:hypothetical protein n=1 Tax=Flavobacterium sp. N502540 TaxID=2986838 RepID=UPI00222527F0|nr:hypothetical protein [Flavobacterium sp. N502540]